MKKLLTIMLAALLCVTALAGCGSKGGNDTVGPTPTEVDSATFEELLAAGIKNGNKLTVYTTHSVIEDAIKAFALKYGVPAEMVEATQIGDTNQITQ